ncbi:MAG: NEW3 domain-containing protein, partial [Gemmatimonadales bacterium]
ALECGTTTLGSSCSTIEYGDTQDTMGTPNAGHFNAFQKERLGWLNYGSSPAIATVEGDGDYWLDPYESGPGADAKALKILKSADPTTGKKTWYYVEYRQAIGFDSFLASNSNVLNGVVVRTGSESSGNTSYLLDMTPATSSWTDPALVVGQTFYDPDAGVTIAPTWSDGSNAVVSVSFGPLACVPANPTVALSPSQSQWAPAGSPATYIVTVTNRDNTACSAAGFNLGAALPSGWTAAFANPMVSLDPGASASTTVTVTSPLSAADGFYTFPVAATNSADASYAASAPATVVIVSALEVSVTSDRASYALNQWVSLTATVGANGSPVANAGVTFTVIKSNGSTLTLSSTTNASGAAAARFRLNKKDLLGVYQARADAALNSAVSGSATTSFTVQ